MRPLVPVERNGPSTAVTIHAIIKVLVLWSYSYFLYPNRLGGKDKFAEFVLRLVSDDLVRGSADADDVGKNQIRSLRNIDTVFPYVVSDISKQKIERIETLRNFWQDSWYPSNERVTTHPR